MPGGPAHYSLLWSLVNVIPNGAICGHPIDIKTEYLRSSSGEISFASAFATLTANKQIVMAQLKTLIIGGGVAGPALAYWLARVGVQVTIIERMATMRASGQQLDLRAQGIPMMDKMGIREAVEAVVVREKGTQLIDINGKTQVFIPTAEKGSARQSLSSEFEIMRGDLVRILYRLTETCDNVKHVFNATVESFTQDDESDPHGKVHVVFSDGRKEDFDLVVGADGTGSRTRKLMLGPDAPDPRKKYGSYIGYFSVPTSPEDSDAFTMCHLPGGKMARIIATRKDCPELTRVYMMCRGQNDALDAALKSGNVEDCKKAWADIYEDGAWECSRFMKLLRACPEADDIYGTHFQYVDLPEGGWSNGRVSLIGDAAHSHTANGVGTTWALLGAYIFAGEVATMLKKDGGLDDPSAAIIQGLKNYEKTLRPITTSSDKFMWVANLLFQRTAIGIWLLHSLMKIVTYFHFDQGMGQDSDAQEWKLPDYPALEEKLN